MENSESYTRFALTPYIRPGTLLLKSPNWHEPNTSLTPRCSVKGLFGPEVVVLLRLLRIRFFSTTYFFPAWGRATGVAPLRSLTFRNPSTQSCRTNNIKKDCQP